MSIYFAISVHNPMEYFIAVYINNQATSQAKFNMFVYIIIDLAKYWGNLPYDYTRNFLLYINMFKEKDISASRNDSSFSRWLKLVVGSLKWLTFYTLCNFSHMMNMFYQFQPEIHNEYLYTFDFTYSNSISWYFVTITINFKMILIFIFKAVTAINNLQKDVQMFFKYSYWQIIKYLNILSWVFIQVRR